MRKAKWTHKKAEAKKMDCLILDFKKKEEITKGTIIVDQELGGSKWREGGGEKNER